ncbi:TonB-dependent siderophore receptor [Brevundimonas sp.]|uniref:TonB-dependent receptor plug domain-containing protein n=1 Tax=Brevundimonas sp. TaxID=1871086 RepID=UPI002737D942|nr:TonB-dependent receptor [Brevundimonas sp.]MDP3801767.1 TonB-dependent receptor [Brevundimonas sp.]
MRAYRRMALKAALLGTCLMTPMAAFAQDGSDPAPQEASDLDDVIVTGTIQYRDRTNTTAPELVYDQEFFAKFEPTSVGDQLRRVPGVAFTSDVGEADAPQLRGLGQGFTQVLVNGRPIPGAGNDRSVFVDRIPAEIIDRIEIVRSPSADIDSQGVGGTINIILKDGESLPPGVIARVGATYDVDASRTRPNASVSWSGRNASDTLLYSITLDAQQRFNNKDVVEEVFEEDSVGFDAEVAAGGMGRSLVQFDDPSQSVAVERVEEQDSRDSTDLSFNGDLTWRMSENTSLRIDAFALSTSRKEHQDTVIYEGDGSVGGLDLANPEFEYQDADFNQDSIGASALFETVLGENTDFEAQVRFNNFRDDSVEETFEDTPTDLVERESIDADDTEWTADASITHQLVGLASAMGIDGVELKVGVSGKLKDREYGLTLEEDLADPDYATNDGQFTYEETRLDAFARIEWELTPSLTLQTGVRAESTKTEITFQNDFLEGGVLDDSISGSSESDEFMLNPSAHLVWKVTNNDQLRFSAARTVRRPSIDQLIPAFSVESPGDEDVTIGNPDLGFETSVGFDIGYERRFAGRGIFGVNLFSRQITDLIGLVNTGDSVATIGLDPADYPGGLYSYRNIGDAEVHGIELDLSTPLTFLGLDETGVFANYTRLWSTRDDPDGVGEIAIDYQPDYIYNFGVTQNLPSIEASFGFSYQKQGESRFVTFGEIESQIYDGNLEIFLEKRLGENIVLRLTGTNLLDAESQQAEAGFDGDNGEQILANQAAYNVDAFEVEREGSSPKITLTLRAVF